MPTCVAFDVDVLERGGFASVNSVDRVRSQTQTASMSRAVGVPSTPTVRTGASP